MYKLIRRFLTTNNQTLTFVCHVYAFITFDIGHLWDFSNWKKKSGDFSSIYCLSVQHVMHIHLQSMVIGFYFLLCLCDRNAFVKFVLVRCKHQPNRHLGIGWMILNKPSVSFPFLF